MTVVGTGLAYILYGFILLVLFVAGISLSVGWIVFMVRKLEEDSYWPLGLSLLALFYFIGYAATH